MIGLAIFASLAVILFCFLLWSRRSRVRSPKVGQPPAMLRIEPILPRHYLYFPQIRQALSARDEEYLERVAPRDVAGVAHRERRAVARHFLAGLREDFSNLERLARMVAALSPGISSEQETERIILRLGVVASFNRTSTAGTDRGTDGRCREACNAHGGRHGCRWCAIGPWAQLQS
jgi:hypothetical protein